MLNPVSPGLRLGLLKIVAYCASLVIMSEARTRQRELPSVDRLLTHPRTGAWLVSLSREYVTRCCREVLERCRVAIVSGELAPESRLDEDSILAQVERRIESDRAPSLRPVINATGTVLHTNLGRALLAPSAIEAICLVATRPSNLEYDLEKGRRGKREAMIERLLVWLSGAEAATCVNNNAAAVLIAVNTLANGKEVVVSRGELVEIGGAFRIPDILAKSGATLREVGTTNRTHPGDYERAIGPNTGLLLKVHASNYRIVGFSAEVPLNQLVDMGRRHHVPVMEDLGSGALVDLSQYGLPREPLVSQRVACGADIVTFSGDKLLGGPQAGLVVGTRRWLTEIGQNPLHRAVRCDKLTIAALEATLRLYQQSRDITRQIPTLQLLTRSLTEMERLGAEVVPILQQALGSGYRVSIEDATSQIGSGALPTEDIPTKVITVDSDVMSAERIAERFRAALPAIIGRINGGRFLLDLRTISSADELIPRWHTTGQGS
jgi:L-seryl-tRNA(Ser) seleniumtransferase